MRVFGTNTPVGTYYAFGLLEGPTFSKEECAQTVRSFSYAW